MNSQLKAGLIQTLFEPRSIAVVGASPTGAGRVVMENFKTAEYRGGLYGVNPKHAEVLGWPCLATLEALPQPPDVVVLSLARERVVPAVEAAARAGARAAVVFAIGFAEADAVGADLQRRLVEIAEMAGMAILGPNCQGLLNFADGIPLYMDVTSPYEAGRVALVSQSGSVATSLINNTRGVRWSHAVSSGNEAVVTAGDVLSYYVDSPAVDVICAFLETIRDADFFFEQCDRAWEAGKPIIVSMAGRTHEAQAAAAAHSGTLAPPARLVDAALAHHNVVRVDSLEELLETAVAMQSRRRPRGRGVAVLSGSGGQIELYHDNVPRTQLDTPAFSKETEAELRGFLAPYLGVENPLDWWGTPDWASRQGDIVDCVARDPRIDVILQIGEFTAWPTGKDMRARGALDTSRRVNATRTEELFVVLDSLGGAPAREHVESGLEDDVLVLSGYETGLRALGHFVDYHIRRAGWEATPTPRNERTFTPPPDLGLSPLELLAAAGFDVTRSILLDSKKALDGAVLATLNYPLVAKIGDREVLHKTELGGVVVGITSPEELAAAIRRLRARGARTVLIQEQVSDGIELFLGLEAAADLGTFVVVGLGGIWTEVLDDVQIRPVGITRGAVEAMLRGLRGYSLLTGGRGTPPVNMERLVEAVLRLDSLGTALGERLRSLDINPLIVTGERAVVVDAALITAHQRQSRAPQPEGAP